MSAIADVPTIFPAPPPRRAGRDWSAIADQALISGANFVTMILVAWGLGGPTEFGMFTLVYSALLFANIFQSALVTQPHNVLGTSRHGGDYAAYTSSILLLQILLAGSEAIVALVVAIAGWRLGWANTPLLFALAPSIVAWQLQEFIRRVLYTEGRHAAAFINDLISYGGQMLLIAAMWLIDRNRGTHWLSGASVLYVLAVTSLAAAVLGVWQIRSGLTCQFSVAAWRENWQFGKWLAGSELLTWCSSVQMYLYLAAAVLGLTVTGDLKAAQVLFGPTRVLAYYLDTVLPIRFARMIAAGGGKSVGAGMARVLSKIVAPLACYCAFVAILARPLLKLTFGQKFAGASTILALYSGYAFLTYLQLVAAAGLKAQRKTHYIFGGSACGVVIALLGGLALSAWLGTNGILIAMIVAALVVTILYFSAFRRTNAVTTRRGFDVLIRATETEAACPS
jgi:O-antigen/teichoic acid export membrane protein